MSFSFDFYLYHFLLLAYFDYLPLLMFYEILLLNNLILRELIYKIYKLLLAYLISIISDSLELSIGDYSLQNHP
jgi:hypothetical protein